MNSKITCALVAYINLLHQGRTERPLFDFYKTDLENSTAEEVNLAIENLILRHKDVEAVETTVARFIRAAGNGLDNQPPLPCPEKSIFTILMSENSKISEMLSRLKTTYKNLLPGIRHSDFWESLPHRQIFAAELEKLNKIRLHYLKLQYGLFTALEKLAPHISCIKLMWYLEDSGLKSLTDCIEMLRDEDVFDFKRFNQIYGQLFFIVSSLEYRERKILFPLAIQILPNEVQEDLLSELESYGLIE